MALSVGDRFGPYEVVGALGAGGMGQVYRARDSRLGRDVALKILSDLVARDPERIARFEREARTLASLSHPNIAGIHGLEDSGGVQALVLELVEGPTLADRLASGPIPIDEALVVARQIADALEAAHDLGIIHRDLKPANIKLRLDGTVKVLDFGLAKAVAAAQGADPSDGNRSPAHLSHSPTITGPVGMTGVGVLLGTAAYMAPEQARGKPVDKRADIWAFGCVLFEMLTGKRCFDGEDVSLTLAEVIKSEPDWKALPAGVSSVVQSTLTQCLQKDPKRRIRDIGDVRLALDGGFGVPTGHVDDRPVTVRRQWTAFALCGVIGAAVGAIAVAAAIWTRSAPRAEASIDRFTVTLPLGTGFRDNVAYPMALTSDGRRIVMNVSSAGTDRVLVRTLDQLQPQFVQGLEGVVGSILLSPDDEWVAFNDSKGSLKKMRLSGGPAVTIAETGIASGGWQGASWGTAGTIVFSTSANRALMEVPEAGGALKPRTTTRENESHQQPHFLPDGRSLLFQVRQTPESNIVAYLPAGATDHVKLLEGSDPRYLPSGHLLFTREGAMWAVHFDPTTGRMSGDPVPVLEGVTVLGSGVAKASMSRDGTLAYVAGTSGAERIVVLVDRQGHAEALPGLTPNDYAMIRLSPDGGRLAYTAGRPMDLWTYDLARGTSVRVTRDDRIERGPLWSPDGSRLIFATAGGGRSDLFVKNADGTGIAEPFPAPTGLPGIGMPEAWSADGKTLIFTMVRERAPDLHAVTLDRVSELRELIATPSVDSAAVISPDGRWLAYQSDMSGAFEVYVERFPETGDRQKISTSGGTLPRWSSTGGEIFYQGRDGRQVFAVTVSSGSKFTAGVATRIFEGSFVPAAPTVRGFDVTPDGRFIMLRSATADAGAVPSVVVVQNWVEELKRLVPPPAGR